LLYYKLKTNIIMNSKTVLSKVKSLLSFEKEAVKFTYAKLSDGTIVESATFDVGETIEVVSEDGTKSPAPDGTHELSLRDEEGNETLFKVVTEGGVITERENIEMEEETIETEPLPGDPTEMTKEGKPTEMAEEGISVNEEVVDETPAMEITLEDVAKKMEEMSYKIDELEKKLSVKEEEMEEVTEEELEDEEEDKKLDGAPLEATKMNSQRKKSNKPKSYHDSVLSKLYK
jgi:hypothetical protein